MSEPPCFPFQRQLTWGKSQINKSTKAPTIQDARGSVPAAQGTLWGHGSWAAVMRCWAASENGGRCGVCVAVVP